MYWEEKIETMVREDLDALQLARLKRTVQKASESYYYKRVFEENGLNPNNITSLNDVRSIPFTTKEALREHWPYGFLAVPKTDLVRVHSSSGTTGRATAIFHTAADINVWADLVARSMYGAGMRKDDVFQNMMTYGLFTGGLGFHYGAERLGALVIPAGAGNSRRQIQLMKDFETTVIHIIPSYALHLYSLFEELGVNPKTDTRLRLAFIGAEPHSTRTRDKIQELYGVKAFNSYGLSEMNGPGVAFECEVQMGMHIWEDHFLIEVINPDTLEPVPDGEEGELVMTTLMREGMPVLRYRTRDITKIYTEPCPCGRIHRRIERIKGRTDNMMIIKGVNVFPVQIEKTLMNVPGVGTNFQIILEREGYDDIMHIKVEIQKDVFTGNVKQLESLRRRIVDELKNETLVTPKVELVEHNSLPQSEGKAVRVIDNRKD
ncbi:MAG: phenylacetate--CoA ligase [Deltaproteobacteria bacterium]|nr:phenylacetate--CoA ligase [Deltaproteobacteria bacterium]MBN2688655.1 phenylacetate--CoA ligase [Deltaproteobacteria bacterium]